MNRIFLVIVCLLLPTPSLSGAAAAERSVTLAIPSITCGLCEEKIRGIVGSGRDVERIAVDKDARTARIFIGGGNGFETDSAVLRIRTAGYACEIVSEMMIYRLSGPRDTVRWKWQEYADALKRTPGVKAVIAGASTPSATQLEYWLLVTVEKGRVTEEEISAAVKVPTSLEFTRVKAP